jgi:hypothetical protein
MKEGRAILVYDGKCIEVFLIHKIDFQESAPEPDRVYTGDLFCDEMKLQSGIVMPTKNHALVGFADNIESFDDIVDDFLNESNNEEEEKGAKLATYVN